MATDQALARDRKSTAATLRRLSKNSAVRVRQAVASNLSTPKEILHEMASDPSTKVRVAVAQNENTFIKTQLLLVRDNIQVRMALADDNGWYIRDARVRAFLANDDDAEVRKIFAGRYPYEKKWSKDADRSVRLIVAQNARHVDVLSEFLTDADADVARAAIRTLHDVMDSRVVEIDPLAEPWIRDENANKSVTLGMPEILALLGAVQNMVNE